MDNRVLCKEQPQPRKEGADRNLFEGETGFRCMIPQHLAPEPPQKHNIRRKGLNVWVRPSVEPAEAGVVSGRVRRSPALRQRSWPNVDNQRTPRGYAGYPNPGKVTFTQKKAARRVAYATLAALLLNKHRLNYGLQIEVTGR